jgi:biotin synthase
VNVRQTVRDIVDRAFDGAPLEQEQIATLVEIEPHSMAAGLVVAAADRMNRLCSDSKAEVHAQIGLNLSPCPRNCSFCAFAAKNRVFSEETEFSLDQVVDMAMRAETAGANALFLMATGNYDFGKFVEISQEVRRRVAPDTTMVANIGDFNGEQAGTLRDAGYAGIYHAVRMGEGQVTRIPPETRLRTVRAAREAGLIVGTCVEPIGPEHSTEEIVEKTLIGRDMQPCYSGAMRRIPIPGSELEPHGTISEYRMAYLVAVVRLAMGPEVRGNCTHEPNLLGAASGANLFWAEVGSNPRDTEEETSGSRGRDVAACREMFREADWELLEGPSALYRSS